MSTLENLFSFLAFLVLMYSIAVVFKHPVSTSFSWSFYAWQKLFPQSSSWCPLGGKQPFIFSLSNCSFKAWGVFWPFSPQNNWPITFQCCIFQKIQKKSQINVKKQKKKKMDCVIALPIYCDHASSLASSTRPNVHSKTMLVKCSHVTARFVLPASW